jgi:hypothetical protein
MAAVSDSAGSSPVAVSHERRAPPAMASTTSFSVQPSRSFTARTSARGSLVHA